MDIIVYYVELFQTSCLSGGQPAALADGLPGGGWLRQQIGEHVHGAVERPGERYSLSFVLPLTLREASNTCW